MGACLEFLPRVGPLAAFLITALVGAGCGAESAGERAGIRFEGAEAGDCDDGADNDADGQFDCDDTGCVGAPVCTIGGAGGSGGHGGTGGSGGSGGAGGSGGHGGAGGMGGGDGLVFCGNPDVAAPSCALASYSLADDSALRAKLEGCAAAGCHGSASVTTWTVDLSGSVENALTALTNVTSQSGDYLVDGFDPDCSLMLTMVTDKPAGGIREPLTGGYWSQDEIDCFRAYLNELELPSRCDDVCGLPDECFVEFGIPVQGGDCITNCEAQVEVSGSACINAIWDTVACLGTCDVESLTVEQQLACQDEALVIQTECE